MRGGGDSLGRQAHKIQGTSRYVDAGQAKYQIAALSQTAFL